MSILSKLKSIFSFPDSKYFWYICKNCDHVFDGKKVELFIKHQIDNKHYNVEKVSKV